MSEWLAGPDGQARQRGLSTAAMPSFIRSIVACCGLAPDDRGFHGYRDWRVRWFSLDRYADEPGRRARPPRPADAPGRRARPTSPADEPGRRARPSRPRARRAHGRPNWMSSGQVRAAISSGVRGQPCWSQSAATPMRAPAV